MNFNGVLRAAFFFVFGWFIFFFFFSVDVFFGDIIFIWGGRGIVLSRIEFSWVLMGFNSFCLFDRRGLEGGGSQTPFKPPPPPLMDIDDFCVMKEVAGKYVYMYISKCVYTYTSVNPPADLGAFSFLLLYSLSPVSNDEGF